MITMIILLDVYQPRARCNWLQFPSIVPAHQVPVRLPIIFSSQQWIRTDQFSLAIMESIVRKMLGNTCRNVCVWCTLVYILWYTTIKIFWSQLELWNVAGFVVFNYYYEATTDKWNLIEDSHAEESYLIWDRMLCDCVRLSVMSELISATAKPRCTHTYVRTLSHPAPAYTYPY